jgi:hypothetical protein
MSRRTKRIILASFLLLLSATVGTIILTWTTPNPLRFRAIECHNASSPGQTFQTWKVRMVVENVSHIPVYLFEAELRKPQPHMKSRKLHPAFAPVPKPIIGPVEFDPQTVPYPHFSTLIPPGQTRECYFYMYPKKDPVGWIQDIDVHYSWISYTASKADHLRARLRKMVPEHWRSHIPRRLYERDITPMDSDSLPPPIMPVLVKAAPVKVTPVIASPTTPSPRHHPSPASNGEASSPLRHEPPPTHPSRQRHYRPLASPSSCAFLYGPPGGPLSTRTTSSHPLTLTFHLGIPPCPIASSWPPSQFSASRSPSLPAISSSPRECVIHCSSAFSAHPCW